MRILSSERQLMGITNMKMRGKCGVISTILIVAALPIQLAAQDQSGDQKSLTNYVVKDLGTLGGTGSVAEGISDRNWVIGSANLPGDQNGHVFLWRDGIKTDLGTLGGPNSSEQWPVKDNRGLIAAVGETSGADPLGENFCGFNTGLTCLGFLWQGGKKTPLPTLGGNNGQALGINNQGQVVGYAENRTVDSTCVPPQVLDFEAVIWGPKTAQVQQLPPLPGDTVTAASGINDHGRVVGVSGVCSDPTSHGVIWENRVVTDLGNLGGVLNTIPWAINFDGQVVGQSDLAGDTTLHAFLWNKRNGMRDLGTLPGDSASLAFGTNNNGQVVGGSCLDATFNSCTAFLWQHGVMSDLNALVKPGSTPLYLFFGNDINSRGEIAAYGFDQSNGEFHAALAIPWQEQQVQDDVRGPAALTTRASDRPKITLPENIRRLLQQKLRFGQR